MLLPTAWTYSSCKSVLQLVWMQWTVCVSAQKQPVKWPETCWTCEPSGGHACAHGGRLDIDWTLVSRRGLSLLDVTLTWVNKSTNTCWWRDYPNYWAEQLVQQEAYSTAPWRKIHQVSVWTCLPSFKCAPNCHYDCVAGAYFAQLPLRITRLTFLD